MWMEEYDIGVYVWAHFNIILTSLIFSSNKGIIKIVKQKNRAQIYKTTLGRGIKNCRLLAD